MPKKTSDLFALQKSLLKYVGISLDPNKRGFYEVYSTVVLFLMLTIPFVQMYTGFLYIPDFEMVAEILVYPIFTVTVYIKVLVIIKNKTRLTSLLAAFEQGLFVPNAKRGGNIEKELVKNCTLTADSLVRYSGLSTAVVLAALPIVSIGMSISSGDCNKWQFGYGPILNVTCTLYVYPVFIYQCVVMGYFGFTYVFIFFLLIGVLMHIRCHFKILQNAIRKITSTRDFEEIVNYHACILDLSQELKLFFSPILLLLFCVDLFLLGSMMTLIIECPRDSVKCTRGILCYMILISLLFFVSYWGNKVNYESRSVADACSEVDFIGLELEAQKSLILIIQRSQKPFAFTAGGFVDVSLDSFVQILRGSYSYFMLLYNASNKKIGMA